MSKKNSSDTIGNRTRDLSTCSAVPQPTALPRAPLTRVDYCYCITESCPVHAMKEKVEVLLLSFLTAVRYGASRPGIFIPWKELPVSTENEGGWTQSQSGRFGEGKMIRILRVN